MGPTRILSNEHRVIEVVLDCLEQIAKNGIKDERLDQESAGQAIDFIRTFADKCHHGKEETHLFAAMVEKGIPRDGGPIGQMLAEHERGRAYVRDMAESITDASAGDAEALQAFSSAAHGYIRLLRAHIQKEDGVLFPMADRILTDSDRKDLMAAFESAESEHLGEGTHERFVRLAQTLAEKFDVSKAALPSHL